MTKIQTREELADTLRQVDSLKAEVEELRAIAIQSQQMVEKLLGTVQAQNKIISALDDMSEHRITNKDLERELTNIFTTMPRGQAQKFLAMADMGFEGMTL